MGPRGQAVVGARLGQHFLRDERVLDDVVRATQIRSGETLLEIGPGPGNLTARLAQGVGATGTVVAVEADPLLAHGLKGRWPNVSLVVADAVRIDLRAPDGQPRRFTGIVANLPYLISGPITFAFLDLLVQAESRWERAVLMYQAEFAERLLASPGSKAYGRITVHAARQVRVEKVRDVSPGCFEPPPQVDSMVLRLVPHSAPPFAVEDEALFRRVVDGAFQQRRKKMRNTVAGAVGGDRTAVHQILDQLGLGEKRPEDVAPHEFAALANALGA